MSEAAKVLDAIIRNEPAQAVESVQELLKARAALLVKECANPSTDAESEDDEKDGDEDER